MLNKYSPSLNTFYLAQFYQRYEAAHSMPDDAFDVDDSIFNEFTGEPPEGKERQAGKDGLPYWKEI